MNAVFCMMIVAGVAAACAQGESQLAQHALLTGGAEAVTLCLELAGSYAFFSGMLGVLRESGVTEAFAARLRRPMMHLFDFRPGEEQALDDICVNLSADMLGMGGAATPAGLRAMRTMAQANGGSAYASEAMALFLVLNMCSVQLLPATMIALRAQAGAKNPADIILPSLVSTLASAFTGIALCKVFSKWSKKHG